VQTEEYEDFGIPATILANYLRENGIIPEKCDLNSILFLLTPAETIPKIENLVAALVRFEELIERDAPLDHVLPSIYSAHRDRYAGYSIRELAQEMHDFYKDRNVKQLQKIMFREEHFPHVALAPHLANDEFTRGNVELVAIRDIAGRVAAEGALPYPPGILCVVPGEVWGAEQRDYFLALEEGINLLAGFAPELQGVHLLTEPDGQIRAHGYVLTDVLAAS
jgi:ornithine decarboxylase